MESEIIKEIEMILELPLHEKQKTYFQDLLKAAKPVKIVRAAKWRLRTANISKQAGTDILRPRNIPQFGRKQRVRIADTKRVTNRVINNKN